MVTSKATTVKEYLASLPDDRRKTVDAVRKVVKKALPKGYVEGIQFGFIAWYVPLKRFPDTYNKQPLTIAALASQKQYVSLYLMGAYSDPKLAKRFEKNFAAAGKKLNMGKSCLRFKKLDDLAMDAVVDVIGAISVDDYCAQHEKVHGSARKLRASRTAKKKPAKKKPAKKKPAKKKPAKKKPAKKKR